MVPSAQLPIAQQARAAVRALLVIFFRHAEILRRAPSRFLKQTHRETFLSKLLCSRDIWTRLQTTGVLLPFCCWLLTDHCYAFTVEMLEFLCFLEIRPVIGEIRDTHRRLNAESLHLQLSEVKRKHCSVWKLEQSLRTGRDSDNPRNSRKTDRKNQGMMFVLMSPSRTGAIECSRHRGLALCSRCVRSEYSSEEL
jgi:hypothetical protein